jgi:translocation and assembly module TamA
VISFHTFSNDHEAIKMKCKLKQLGVGALALCFAAPVMAAPTIKIQGVKGELKNNVMSYISSIPQKDYNATPRFKKQLEKEITQALNALGYYNPTFDYHSEGLGNKLKINVKIDSGPAITITKSDIEILGEAKSDPDFISLVKESGLLLNDPLNQGKYEALKASLLNLAIRKGYFKAEMEKNQLAIVPSRNEAFVTLIFNSGPRFHYGKTEFMGSQIQDSNLKAMIPYKEGQPYLVSSLGQYNQDLSNTGWFSSIFVGADMDAIKGDTVPIKVSVEPQVKNQMEVGIGYSTDVGPRLQFKWKKPWLNSRGDSLDIETELSKVQPKLQATYTIPVGNVLTDNYQFTGGIQYVDNHDTIATEFNAGIARHWRLPSGWNRTVSLRWLHEIYKQGSSEEGTANLYLPGISFSRTQSHGGLMPTWGNSQQFSIEFADPLLGSNARLLRLHGRSVWLRSFGQNKDQRAIFRLDGGAVFAKSIKDVPPSMRFFIGGDNSIRGYGYDSIAPRDNKGELLGGQYMLTSSIEYQHRIYGNWWGALFYDYGSSWTKHPHWKQGAGFGLRWASPIGPVRLDFAWGLNKKADRFQLNFVLGPEL